MRKAIEKQAVVTERPEDLDVIGIHGDDLEAAVQVFYVRRGRVMGRKGFVVDKVEDVTPEQLMGHVLEGLYYDADPASVPKEVLVPDMPDDPDLYREWLTGQRGSNVSIRVPQRGDKRALQAMVTQNAKEEFVRHRLKRASDHNARARALNSLQEALDLPDPPLRIECYDMSHIQGSDYVGSMVVMEDGLTKKSEYRRFKIRDVPGNDDFAAMEEVLTRRLTALLVERERPVGDRPRKFAYPPNLLLVDGGKGQLSVAIKVVEDLGLEDEISVASLAKRFEEVFVPGQADPIRIPRQSEALYLLQRLRDEAHRFAIDYHRQLRGKRMIKSSIDDIPGLGPDPRRSGWSRSWGASPRSRPRRWTTWWPCRGCRTQVAIAVYERFHRQCLRISDRSLWETHAGWWQRAFTDGADAEYTEQIIPLAAEHLAGAVTGARRRHRRGPAGPGGRRRRRPGGGRRPVVGPAGRGPAGGAGGRRT